MRGMGNMGNMNKMMKQMQKMQKDMAKAQEEVANTIVEGTAGGGMVTVKANGSKQILEVTINEDVVDPDDIEMLQDLVVAATNDAMKQVDEVSDKLMGPFTQGLNVPGLF